MEQFVKRREPGQSIPLIALMMVVLLAFVALSVDVGNTYAQQRSAVRATNAASLAALDGVIKGYSDESIAKIIRESLKSNGIALQSDGTTTEDGRTVRAYYMDVDGRHIGSCDIGTCATVPAQVNYVQVTLEGDVQTYFARVVGRPTLPVAATAYAYRCAPVNGVYPIAIWQKDLDLVKNQFLAPSNASAENNGTYYDDVYTAGKKWRRVPLKGNQDIPGNFGFMRWSSKNWNENDLAAALTGDGTLSSGFTEMPTWPSGKSGEPSNYPLAPNQLNATDWAYADSGLSWSNSASGVRTALVNHMNNRTMMILPIVDDSTGAGSNGSFKVAALGKFMIVDTTKMDGRSDGGVSKNGGANAFLDLVYLGPATETPCLVTDLDPIKDQLQPQPITVSIPFQLKPQYTDETVPSQPIAYQLVVDVSGSMSWDFRGNGTFGGTVKANKDTTGSITNRRCEFAATDMTYQYDDTCTGGPNSPWWKYTDRRIYLTKQAITAFINGMRPGDQMRYTAFSTRGDFSSNTLVVPSSGFTDDKTVLINALNGLGSLNGDPYRTEGGTPGAQAMQKARAVVATAPDSYMGRKYKPVVIYLTDGVANVTLSGKTNDVCAGYTRMQAINSPDCQIGPELTSGGEVKPISAMVDQADLLKKEGTDKDTQIYVVALANTAERGLSQVASPGRLSIAQQGFEVQPVLNKIQEIAENNTCIDKESPWIDRIGSGRQSDFTGAFALPPDVYGKATVWNENGTAKVLENVPIVHNTQNGGNLGITTDLQPGKYQLEAWIGYKATENKPYPATYRYSFLSYNKIDFSDRVSFTVDEGLNYSDVLPTTYVGYKPGTSLCK